jgi:hypothetical protein
MTIRGSMSASMLTDKPRHDSQLIGANLVRVYCQKSDQLLEFCVAATLGGQWRTAAGVSYASYNQNRRYQYL